MKTRRVLCAIVMTTLAILFVACGARAKMQEASDRIKYSNDMKALGLAMYNYEALNNGRMPNNIDELTKKTEVPPDTVALVKSGEINVVWGPWKFKDQLNGVSFTVMAWSNAPIFKGDVCVLTCDGSVRQMPQTEFAAMPKAAVKPEAESSIRK